MRFRGNHNFTPADVITVEEDNENVHDANAVRVMVESPDGTRAHAAYASRGDCLRLRQAISAGRTSASFVRHHPQHATLSLA